jgi:hypothetical protein
LLSEVDMLAAIKITLKPVYHKSGAAKLARAWRRRPAAYEVERAAYMRSHITVAEPMPSDPLLAALVENGFVVVPDLHSHDYIAALREKIHDIATRVRRGEQNPTWKLTTYQEDGIYRVRDIEQVVPEVRQLLDHPVTNQLTQRYLRTSAFRTTGNYVDFKPDLVHDYTTVPHLDSWKSQIKIFTPLADVGDENAPLAYWAKTHRDGEWRRRFDHAIWSGDYIGSGGIVPPHVLRDLARRGGPDAPHEVVVTIPAGSAIVADTRGIHRASSLRAGYRLQIVQKFTVT